MTARKGNSNDKVSLGREQRNEARVERGHELVCLHFEDESSEDMFASQWERSVECERSLKSEVIEEVRRMGSAWKGCIGGKRRCLHRQLFP